jgi:hypothetical protein
MSDNNTDYTNNLNINKCDVEKSVPFNLHQELGVNSNSGFECSIQYIHESSDLSHAFFSRRNIDNIHIKIIKGVNTESGTKNWVIARQSEEALEIVMRSMYLQHAKHLPVQIQQQVICLNKIVIDYCVKNINTNINAHIGYIKNISALPSIPINPAATSSKSNNTELQCDVGFVNFSRGN